MPDIPAPAVMPVDRAQWRREIHLSNFVNTACQVSDLRESGAGNRLLIVGPGQGLDTHVLRWLGYDVTTFDIDYMFEPDEIGSVNDLSRFADGSFDAVIASHVLEHMAVPYLESALSEIARVGRVALVYLPVHGRHTHLRFIPGFSRFELSIVVDLFNWFHKPDGVTARYTGGQHFWEVGMRGFRVRDLRARFSRHFDVVKVYRNRDWLPSLNFVLRSKWQPSR